jgi:hypothetical protein
MEANGFVDAATLVSLVCSGPIQGAKRVVEHA